MFYDMVSKKFLENCKIKQWTKKLYTATYTINNISQTQTFKLVGNIGKIKIVAKIDLSLELEKLKYGSGE